MGVNKINKIIVPIIVLILLSGFALAAITDDTGAMQQLNNRLEQNKAEVIKAIKDTQAANQNATSAFIDQNFQTLDQRIQDFLKAAKRDMAIIMVAAFLVGFALSQIIRLSIERAKRKSLIKRGIELEVTIQKLEKEATDFSSKVRQLKTLDEKYSQDLKRLTRKEPFITLKMVIFGILTLLLGVLLPLILGVKF